MSNILVVQRPHLPSSEVSAEMHLFLPWKDTPSSHAFSSAYLSSSIVLRSRISGDFIIFSGYFEEKLVVRDSFDSLCPSASDPGGARSPDFPFVRHRPAFRLAPDGQISRSGAIAKHFDWRSFPEFLVRAPSPGISIGARLPVFSFGRHHPAFRLPHVPRFFHSGAIAKHFGWRPMVVPQQNPHTKKQG